MLFRSFLKEVRASASTITFLIFLRRNMVLFFLLLDLILLPGPIKKVEYFIFYLHKFLNSLNVFISFLIADGNL